MEQAVARIVGRTHQRSRTRSCASEVLYVGGWGGNGGLVKTDDGGQTWSKLGLPVGNVGVIEIASTRPQTVYAEDDGLWKTTDGGATWQRLPLRPYR